MASTLLMRNGPMTVRIAMFAALFAEMEDLALRLETRTKFPGQSTAYRTILPGQRMDRQGITSALLPRMMSPASVSGAGSNFGQRFCEVRDQFGAED
jgi:hypothetical protein